MTACCDIFEDQDRDHSEAEDHAVAEKSITGDDNRRPRSNFATFLSYQHVPLITPPVPLHRLGLVDTQSGLILDNCTPS